MAPVESRATFLIRVYAALLQKVAELDEASPQDSDPFWTLVGYFNQLRILSSARLYMRSDVPNRVSVVAGRHHAPRSIDRIAELTSRADSSDIPEIRSQMTLTKEDADALDIVLATNMISVGVDVGRLGLMVVEGQPQTTSEYIQATSRVGRQTPALIVTLYQGARSRDRSHYEMFEDYHQKLYAYVEAATLTPFAPRARDKALHAVIVALSRGLVPELRDNRGAAKVAAHMPEIESIIDSIAERFSSASVLDGLPPETLKNEREDVVAEARAFVDSWVRKAARDPNLVYQAPRNAPRANALLLDASQEQNHPSEGRSTLRSMRNVDRECDLYLIEGQ
jgi:hypothetical protein